MTIVMTQIAAVLSVAGVTLLAGDLARSGHAESRRGQRRHRESLRACRSSMIVPALIVGTVAATIGSVGRTVARVDAA